MKYFYIGLLILSLLLCACFWTSRQLRESTEAMVRPLEQALGSIRLGDRSAAHRSVQEAEAAWSRYEPRLDALISHEHTDAVSGALCVLRLSEDSEFERNCTALIRQLRRIGQMDEPVWHNIF